LLLEPIIDAPYAADQEDLSERPGFAGFASERLLLKANYRGLLNQAGNKGLNLSAY